MSFLRGEVPLYVNCIWGKITSSIFEVRPCRVARALGNEHRNRSQATHASALRGVAKSQNRSHNGFKASYLSQQIGMAQWTTRVSFFENYRSISLISAIGVHKTWSR